MCVDRMYRLSAYNQNNHMRMGGSTLESSNYASLQLPRLTEPDSQLSVHCDSKICHLMFYNNFGKCGPISKILSPIGSYENFLYTTKIFISPAICCYTALWNSKIQKCYGIFNWNKNFMWDFTITCHKISLMILLCTKYSSSGTRQQFVEDAVNQEEHF